MVTVVRRRPRLQPYSTELGVVRSLAESCSKQIGAWMISSETSPVRGKRHQTLDKPKQRHRTNQNLSKTDSILGSAFAICYLLSAI
jgi:hypothetical protein